MLSTWFGKYGAGIIAPLLVVGCATVPEPESRPGVFADELPGVTYASTRSDVLQFEPMPTVEVPTQDLQPIQPRPASELLAEANEAFAKANSAQESGDHVLAYQQYTHMMELLLEADLDPSVFYTVRDNVARILSTSTRIAKTFERTRPEAWTQEVVELALRSELDYPNPLNRRVLDEIEAIQRVYPGSFQAGLNRAYRYLPYIRREFEKAGLPEDLMWLAMVESQFTPRINSHAGAGGMWQFMRSTGRRYGLRSDWYIDERYEWKKSTQAAVQYLTELYELFEGEWPLAVTAYNMGEAGLERAVASNGGEHNLWRLIETPPASNRIRRESKEFYAKLLASAIVASNPEKYGFTHPSTTGENSEYVTVKGFYSLHQIEDEVGLSRGTLVKLNPQLIRGYTPPGRTAQLSVPSERRTRIASAMKSMPELRPGTHTVQRGETLSEIASLYRVPARELQTINNIRSPRRLQVGQRLVIPGGTSLSDGGRITANAQGRKVYAVRRGDSLSRIATTHRVHVNDLQRWNNLGNQTRIHVGDRLIVSPNAPAQRTAPIVPSHDILYYTVKKGDYPERIARNHGVSLNDFLSWNGLTKRSTIRIGQKLKILVPGRSVTAGKVAQAPVASGHAAKHTVRPGENPSVIAKKYGAATSDLLRWNNLSKRSVLQIGDVLLVQDPATEAKAPVMQVAEAHTAPPGGTVRVIHRVRNGENPTTIARKYRVPLGDLFDWNGWTKIPLLHIDDEIVIFAPATQ